MEKNKKVGVKRASRKFKKVLRLKSVNKAAKK